MASPSDETGRGSTAGYGRDRLGFLNLLLELQAREDGFDQPSRDAEQRPFCFSQDRYRFFGKCEKRPLLRRFLGRFDIMYGHGGAHRRRRMLGCRHGFLLLRRTFWQNEGKVFEGRKVVPGRTQPVVLTGHLVQIGISPEELRVPFHADPFVLKGADAPSDVESDRPNGRPAPDPPVGPQLAQNLVIRKLSNACGTR